MFAEHLDNQRGRCGKNVVNGMSAVSAGLSRSPAARRLDGVVDPLLFAQRAMEMFPRSLPDQRCQASS